MRTEPEDIELAIRIPFNPNFRIGDKVKVKATYSSSPYYKEYMETTIVSIHTGRITHWYYCDAIPKEGIGQSHWHDVIPAKTLEEKFKEMEL
jgi:hypothetical protein